MGARYYWSKKDEVESYHKISVFDLKRLGYIIGGLKGGLVQGGISWTVNGEKRGSMAIKVDTGIDPRAQFTYSSTDQMSGQVTDYDYRIPMISTPCHYGGVRWWFICPVVNNGAPCDHRVGALYGGAFYGCRHCYNLTYHSRREWKGAFKQPFSWMEYRYKAELAMKKVKRPIYAGKPTKKYLKVLKYDRRAKESLPHIL